MTITSAVQLYVEDIDGAMDEWTSLRLYRASSPDGSFSLVTTIALVAGQHLYEYSDTGASVGSWYRQSYYDSGDASESAQGDPWQVDAVTLDAILEELVRQGDLGFSSTCTALGTTTTLIDATLRDYGQDAHYLEGFWIYRPDAAAAGDRVRRVTRSGFTTASGTLTVVRAWTNAPASSERYFALSLLPPFDAAGAGYTWARAIREGIKECYVHERIYVGLGDGETADFDLSPYQGMLREEDIEAVWLVRTPATSPPTPDIDCGKQGRFYDLIRNGQALTLRLSVLPSDNQAVWVEGDRQFEIPYAATDTTSCPLTLAAKAALWQGYKKLNDQGKYQRELDSAYAEFAAELAKHRSDPAVI